MESAITDSHLTVEAGKVELAGPPPHKIGEADPKKKQPHTS